MSLREEEAAFASDWFCVRLLVGRRARLLDAADPGGPPLRLARPLKVIAYGKWDGPWWALLAGRLYRIGGPGCKRLRVLGRSPEPDLGALFGGAYPKYVPPEGRPWAEDDPRREYWGKRKSPRGL